MKHLMVSCAAIALLTNAAAAAGDHEEKCTSRVVSYQEEVTIQDPSTDNDEQWYASVSGIANLQLDTVIRSTGFAADVEMRGISPGIAVAVGKEFGPKWRLEGELAYRRNIVRDFTVLTNRVYNIGDLSISNGKTTALSLMGNLYRDFQVEDNAEVYVGLGVGVARIGYRDFRAGGKQLLKDYDDQIAGQFIVGVNRHFGENTSFDLSYRYFRAARNNVELKKGLDAEPLYRAHSVFATLRYTFGDRKVTPPARTVMEPRERTEQNCVTVEHEAVAPDPFLVLFDFDSSTLTADAKAILRNAVQAYNELGMASINVVGHTDSSGSASYNQRLSERRAAAVKSELAKMGVSASAISTESKGESEPLIATGDGVREPQNRRAEIVLKK